MNGIVSTTGSSPDIILRAANVSKRYGHRHSELRALDDASLDLRRGEILALVGESGCGKSTMARVLAGNGQPTSGEVSYNGASVPKIRGQALRRRIQMIFQDPYSSLNPRLTVRQVLKELLTFHQVVNRSEAEGEMRRLLDSVGLDEGALDFYPQHFSGGQRQRIAIARALAVRPDVLIADEPVSALDVSIQATVLDVLKSLRSQLDLSVLFIAHNLAVVQHLADRIAVMYLGRIVEIATTSDLFSHPAHPYTRALIESAPRMSFSDGGEAPALRGEPPSPVDLPSGCRFHPRCPFAQQECLSTDPALEGYRHEHEVACIFAGRLWPREIE